MKKVSFLAFAVFLGWSAVACAWHVTDDGGTRVKGHAPVRRIVSLSPAQTEIVFAAGAGARLVGTTQYSNYPPAAKKVPRVGGLGSLSLEAILARHPDMVLAWGGGTPQHVIDRLRGLGIRVVVMRAVRLTAIARHLRMVGRMAGTSKTADAAARKFLRKLQHLRRRYAHARPVRVFYQITLTPLFTVGGRQYINTAISLCGGKNVFADQRAPAPRVSTEAVVQADPQVILYDKRLKAKKVRAYWGRFPGMAAVRSGNVLGLDMLKLGRATPRMLSAVDTLCGVLRHTRSRLDDAEGAADQEGGGS